MRAKSLKRNTRAGWAFVTGAITFVVGACADQPVSPENAPSLSSNVAATSGPGMAVPLNDGVDLDAEWARIAATQIPGFAGYWREQDGSYTVALTSRGNQRQAEDFIRGRSRVRRLGAVMRARRVTFDFSEL